MASRPVNFPLNALQVRKTVKAASAATKYMPGVLDTDSDTVLDATAGQNADVIFMATAAAGEEVACALLTGGCVLPVKVGTAGVTFGEYVEVGTTGVIDRTLGGGTTVRYIIGKALDTQVSADIVGVAIGQFASVS